MSPSLGQGLSSEVVNATIGQGRNSCTLSKQDARFLDFLKYWHARPSEARILIRQAWTGDYLVVTGTLRL